MFSEEKTLLTSLTILEFLKLKFCHEKNCYILFPIKLLCLLIKGYVEWEQWTLNWLKIVKKFKNSYQNVEKSTGPAKIALKIAKASFDKMDVHLTKIINNELLNSLFYNSAELTLVRLIFEGKGERR